MPEIRHPIVYLGFIFLITSVLITCCQQTANPTAVSPLTTPETASSTIEPTEFTATSRYSPLTSPQPSPGSITSNESTAVTGVLALMDPRTLAPREDGLYLVPISTEDKSAMVVPSVDPENSIQADIDESSGRFYFDNVSPGLYAVTAILESGNQHSVRQLDSGKIVVVTVDEANVGETIDLGKLRLP